MAAETAAQRYARDWLGLQDDRKVRGFDGQDVERRDRTYVNRTTGLTTSATGDNVPA